MNVKDHDDLQHMVGYQVRKFNACRKCLKCESLCKAGAISISADRYYIDPEKCGDAGVPVYDLKDLPEKMPPGCRIAILCIPDNVQQTVDLLIENGIIGFVSFVMEHFSVPPGILVRQMDIVSSIQELVFQTNAMKE